MYYIGGRTPNYYLLTSTAQDEKKIEGPLCTTRRKKFGVFGCSMVFETTRNGIDFSSLEK